MALTHAPCYRKQRGMLDTIDIVKERKWQVGENVFFETSPIRAKISLNFSLRRYDSGVTAALT
jgi:hypothetical protein